ncbi:MAG: lysoplasmalogenase [Lewinellaceae bacterium]|nr:lysoplasmalogenase [Saprospiraceae bacterium]MCB9336687.1 lysoplasmalogenase [Lewinellaceae bacterium]
MKTHYGFILPIFLCISLLHLFSIAIHWPIGIYATKPLLLAILAAWFYFKTKPIFKSFTWYFFFGLIFSLLGDIFLMFNGEIYFLLGLGSFLFAHLSYISTFLIYPHFNTGAIKQNPLYAIPFMLFLLLILWFLWPHLGEMKIPVLIYSTVITTMAVSAANMKNRVSNQTYINILLGGVLFIISDMWLAVNKFHSTVLPEPWDHFIIMATYISAQYLLTTGSEMANSKA